MVGLLTLMVVGHGFCTLWGEMLGLHDGCGNNFVIDETVQSRRGDRRFLLADRVGVLRVAEEGVVMIT